MTAADDHRRAYRDIFEASPDPIFVHDPDTGEVVQANVAAAQMLGRDRESVVGMHVGEFSPPGYSTEEANELITEAHETGESHVEWRIAGGDGETRWTSVALRGTTLDGMDRVVAYARDVTEYRLSEQKHRTERNLLDRLLDVSPVGIVIHDADGSILRTNEQAESILGVDREELTGAGAVPDQLRILTVDGDPLSDGEVPAEEVRRTGTDIQNRELTIERADGERVVVSASATPLFDADGAIQRIVVSLADITERRERERRRKERNEQLRTLVDNLPVVVFTLDESGVFTHSTGKGLDSLGLDPGELEGTAVSEAYAGHPDIVEAAERALDGEEIRVTQQIDGLTFETWYRPVFDDDGALDQVVGVARDITDMKRHEERVKRLSDATQQLLYTHSETEIADTVTTIANEILDRPLAAMWSYDEEADVLHPLDAEADRDALSEDDASLDSIPGGTDEMRVFKSGEPTAIEDYQALDSPTDDSAPFRSALGFPLKEHGLFAIASLDVESFGDNERLLLEILASTAAAALDRAERERELREYREELERSNEALQQFAYVASHDLQEPLRMVSSYVDLLESEYGDELDAEAKEYMDFAVDGAQRMQSMIDGLLQYSRVQTRATAFERTDPEAVLESTLTELSLLLDDHGASVEYGDLPAVEADHRQLGQVFQNLVKNAVEHGGATTVTVEASTEDDRVTFAVADDGSGIPEAASDGLFDIFKQGHTDGDGTGIGLAVCERIVVRHDGDIWFDSEDDGTTFYFTMPRYTE